ncbi:hypothetical protein [Dechloromonas sp. H13]|uniref:hypothetical protein n=1 Tax=Dechloromonas sp. H13 TaxID=2570193 RepID=UPI001290A387|nr:hypothetical protein [Dechloromonas sp. H13]
MKTAFPNIPRGTDPTEPTKKPARQAGQIGLLACKATISFRHDFLTTDEELLGANNTPEDTDGSRTQQNSQLKGEID